MWEGGILVDVSISRLFVCDPRIYRGLMNLFFINVTIFLHLWGSPSSWSQSKSVALKKYYRWSIGSDNCNISLTHWRMPTRENNFFYSRVHIGRFDFLHFFLLWAREFGFFFLNVLFWKFTEKGSLYMVLKITLVSDIQCIFGHFR